MKCPKCGTEMYPDVNGDPCCPKCLEESRKEPDKKGKKSEQKPKK